MKSECALWMCIVNALSYYFVLKCKSFSVRWTKFLVSPKNKTSKTRSVHEVHGLLRTLEKFKTSPWRMHCIAFHRSETLYGGLVGKTLSESISLLERNFNLLTSSTTLQSHPLLVFFRKLRKNWPRIVHFHAFRQMNYSANISFKHLRSYFKHQFWFFVDFLGKKLISKFKLKKTISMNSKEIKNIFVHFNPTMFVSNL